ncbi:Metallo-dependent phosphatase-like protein [Xylaria cf. heliscus]|nr:Metallo-dependent phosphatase-like protein [Xylaria cf. heliscus]
MHLYEDQPRRTRRTRFVCVSDTHNCTVRLPKGDVLIHCGDLTNQGSFGELSKQVQWLEQADFECKIVVAGNHDLTLDTDFYNTYGSYRHNKVPQVPEDCQALLTESKSLTYLLHESCNIKLTSSSGPRTIFSVFGSPYSPVWGGAWAFQYPRADEDDMAAKSLWEEIPLDTDILITHGPAHTHLDESRKREAAGCEILRQELWRVRPRLALCGHIHEARGAERVRWDLESKNARYAELGRTTWQDPNPESEKNALVDLTAKGGMPLDNDGSLCISDHQSRKEWHDRQKGKPGVPGETEDRDVAYPGIGTLGLGEDPDSARSDQAALAGRLGRKETCIVNCAIQHSSYPHSGRGPRKLNKPIVVDLDLPVWQDEEEPHEKASEGA